MSIGASIFLLVIGAILTFAVNVTTEGFNINTVGIILMVAGVVGLLLSLLFWSNFSPYRRRSTAFPESAWSRSAASSATTPDPGRPGARPGRPRACGPRPAAAGPSPWLVADQFDPGRRGTNRIAYRSSSIPLVWVSTHPWQSAMSSSSSKVTVWRPDAFL